jgi:hypothetical protein
MAKMIEISAAEYERLQDCIREDGMRIAALIEENKALHQDVRRLRENIDKLRRPSAVSGWRWSVLKCRRSSTASAP